MQDPGSELTDYTLRALSYLEEREQEEIASRAMQEASGAIGRSLRAVAREGIAAAREESDPAEQVNRVRARAGQAIDMDVVSAGADTARAMSQALAAGYETHLLGYHAVMAEQSDAWDAEPDVTREDLEQVRSLPVLGHARQEWAARIAEQLRWELHGALGQAATGATTLEQLPAKIDEIQMQHAKRVGDAVRGAYSTGSAAAGREWRAYLRAVAIDTGQRQT
jgi:hypothetical protein